MNEEIDAFIKELVHFISLPTHDAGTGELLSQEFREKMYADDKANNRITVDYSTNDIRPIQPIILPKTNWRDLIK